MAVEWYAKKLVYFPIPKCACTTLKSVFYRLNFGNEFTSDDIADDGIHGLYAGTPKYRLNILARYAAWRRVIVIRDPVLRFLSAYTSRVLDRGELGEKFVGESARRFEVPLDPDIHQFVQHFDIYQAISPHVRHHFAPHAHFAGPTLDAYTDVYEFDELESLHAMLKSYVDYDFSMPRLQRSTTSLSVDSISVRELCEISGHLAGDYALLRHYYNPTSVLSSRGSRKEWNHLRCPTITLRELLPLGSLLLTEGEQVTPDLTIYLEGCLDGVTIDNGDMTTVQVNTSGGCLVSFEKLAPAFLRLGESYEITVSGWSESEVRITCLVRHGSGEASKYFGTTLATMAPGYNQCCVILDTDMPGPALQEEAFLPNDLKFIAILEAKCGMDVKLKDFDLRPTREWPDQSDIPS